MLERDGVQVYEGSRPLRRRGPRGRAAHRDRVVEREHRGGAQGGAAWRACSTSRVDAQVAEERELHGKPAPDTFLEAAKMLGVAAARTRCVFEDALAGVAAGRAGNFGFVVGVDRVGQADQLRAHGADVVVKDLAELL